MILESFGHLEFTSVCCSDKLSRRFEFLVFFFLEESCCVWLLWSMVRGGISVWCVYEDEELRES